MWETGICEKLREHGTFDEFGPHPEISVVLRISGRMFKIRKNVKIQKNGSSENFGGTSNFRSNVQNPEKRSNSEKWVIRKFRWYFEFPVERSKSRKTFKFRKTGHLKISVVLRISGRTFKIRKNVQIQKNGSSENFGHTPQKSYKNIMKSYKSAGRVSLFCSLADPAALSAPHAFFNTP